MTRTRATVPSAAEWRVPTAADQIIPSVERWFLQAQTQIEAWAAAHSAALEGMRHREHASDLTDILAQVRRLTTNGRERA
jgi:hypothetical protein